MLSGCGAVDLVPGLWVWKNILLLSVSGSCRRGIVRSTGNSMF